MSEQSGSSSNQPGGNRSGSRRGKGGRGRRIGQGRDAALNQLSLAETQRYFLACGRCAAFLAGYRVLHGQEKLETAAANVRDGWLDLDWDVATNLLLHKSYGVRTDVDYYYLEFACPDCQRRLIVSLSETQAEEEEPAPAAIRVRVL